jgi:aminoacyl tRNA synthase complex-interacting multifunctional protein 1
VHRKIEEIQKENEELRKQVEIAKQQLIKIEVANGKKQIPIPTGKTAAAAAVPEPVKEQPAANQESKQPQAKKEKVEKPKKEKAPAADKAPPAVEVIDVGRLDMRIGKIIDVQRHPDADSLYLEKIDCGEPNPRTVVSGLVKFVPIEQMQNRMVIILCNLKPAKMRGVTSEAMVMCASTPEKVEVMDPPPGAVPGDVVSCEGFTRSPDLPFMNPKKKVFETVAPDLKVNGDFVGTYKGAQLFVEGKGPIKSQTLKDVNIK